MAASEAIQTISRLTPLADVLVTIDAEVKPVTQRTIDVSAAAGRALAVDAWHRRARLRHWRCRMAGL